MFKRNRKNKPKRRSSDRRRTEKQDGNEASTSQETELIPHQLLCNEDSSSNSSIYKYENKKVYAGVKYKFNVMNWLRHRNLVKARNKKRIAEVNTVLEVIRQTTEKQIAEVNTILENIRETIEQPIAEVNTILGNILENVEKSISEPTMCGVDTLISIHEQEEASVKKFLKENEVFLQEYVLDNIPFGTIEQWMKQKRQRCAELLAKEDKKKYKFTRSYNLKELAFSLSAPQQNEDENPYKLSGYLCHALNGDGYRVFKLYPGSQGFVHKFAEMREDDGYGNCIKRLILERADAELTNIINKIAAKGNCVTLSRDGNHEEMPATPIDIFHTLLEDQIELVNYVIYIPFFNKNGKPCYMVEIWNMEAFDDSDVELGALFTVWAGIALNYGFASHDKSKIKDVTSKLMDLLILIMERQITMDTLIVEIIKFMQCIVNANRASLFLADIKNQELVSYTMFFNLPHECVPSPKIMHELIRIPINTGIAGHVYQSGETVNIPDAYSDTRFNRSVDVITKFKTSSIMAIPVKNNNKNIGVLEFVNKLGDSNFSHEDEICLETFTEIINVSINYAKLVERIPLDVNFQKCDEQEVKFLLQEAIVSPQGLCDFSLDPFRIPEADKCMEILKMFSDLFQFNQLTFNVDTLARFVVTVKANYKNEPTHNFEHGWAVTQSMFTIICHDRKQRFNKNQRLAMFIASLCHDLDQGQYIQQSIPKEASPLAAVYSTSTSENKQFLMMMSMIHHEELNILAHLSCQDYKYVVNMMKDCIAATDLSLFFPTYERINSLIISDIEEMAFKWQNIDHKYLVIALTMTAADLSSAAKPWEVHLKSVKQMFKEVFAHGQTDSEAEEVLRNLGDCEKRDIVQYKIQFMNTVCIPCFDMLAKFLPGSRPLLSMAITNVDRWQAQVEKDVKRRRQRLRRTKSKIDTDDEEKYIVKQIKPGKDKEGNFKKSRDEPRKSGTRRPEPRKEGMEPQPGPSGLQSKPVRKQRESEKDVKGYKEKDFVWGSDEKEDLKEAMKRSLVTIKKTPDSEDSSSSSS